MTITRELLHPEGDRQGYNKRQLVILGVAWPPKKGWLDALIGRTMSEAVYAEFIAAGKSVTTAPVREPWRATITGPDGTKFTIEAESKGSLFSHLRIHFADRPVFG